MRDFRRRFCIVATAIALLACPVVAFERPAHAAAPKAAAPKDRSADEAALRQAGKDYLAARDAGDKKALVQFWTADGTFTDEAGHTSKVRDLIEQMPEGKPAARRVTNVANESVRFLADTVAIEEGDCDIAAPGTAASVPGRFTALWVKQDGRWKLDNVREGSAPPPPPKSGADELAALNVFVGDWSGEVNEMKVHVAAQWNATKKFLVREITISDGGKAALAARQEIGWDPIGQTISSWIFGDDGSFGEATWTLEGHVWMTPCSRVLPDGRVSSAMHIFRMRDKDTLVWKSIKGKLDGQPVADFEVVLKRTKAEKP